jgi:hypothetical protein
VLIGARGGRNDPVLVTDRGEPFDAMQSIEQQCWLWQLSRDAADEEQITHSCYLPTTKAPDNKALDSLPNRALGKAVSPAELSSDADEV